MGLPEGWVTGVPGLSRNEMLRALGNGVMPLQAATAFSLLLSAWPGGAASPVAYQSFPAIALDLGHKCLTASCLAHRKGMFLQGWPEQDAGKWCHHDNWPCGEGPAGAGTGASP